MIRFIARWLVLTFAVWVATAIVGITYDNTQTLFISALVLAILNAFVKPILLLISLPAIVLSLGFVIILINAFLLWLAAQIVHTLHVNGFWQAIGASLIISLVNFFFGMSSAPRKRRTAATAYTYEPQDSDRRPPPGKGPIIDV